MAGLQANLVLDGLPGAVMAVDADDRITVWSVGAERMFGWSADELIGRPLPIVPPELAAARQEWLRRTFAGEEIEETTQRLHRDGRRLDVVVRYAPVRNGDGTIVGVGVLCRDASSQLHTASRLARSEAELALVRRLAELAQRLLQDLDLSAVLRSLVEVAVDLLDTQAGVLSLEQEPGVYERVTGFNVPEEIAHYRIELGVGLHGTVIDRGEPLTITDHDGDTNVVDIFRERGFHAALGVPITRDGRVIGVISVHAVEPERRFDRHEIEVLVLLAGYASIAIGNARTYRRVSAERARFLALVEAMPAGLALVEDGAVTAWNAAAAALTGWAAADVLGGPPPLDLDAAAGGVEVPVTDGRPRFLEAARSDLPDDGGQLYLIQDLTEQRDLERAKDLFFATTSHELKTPLTVVKGLATTLLKHWDRMEADQRVEALSTIERRAENLDRLIERILVGSRVQAGALDVVPTPVDVARVIEDIVAGFAPLSAKHDVIAELPEEAPLPLVAGDRQVFDTILGHLLENAIKYSPLGGQVAVRASVTEDGQAVVVEVRDEGIGIEGDVERLLRPFVQADSRTTRRFGGVGLGLYIVRQLVDTIHGEFSARNRPDGGAVFSVTVRTWR